MKWPNCNGSVRATGPRAKGNANLTEMVSQAGEQALRPVDVNSGGGRFFVKEISVLQTGAEIAANAMRKGDLHRVLLVMDSKWRRAVQTRARLQIIGEGKRIAQQQIGCLAQDTGAADQRAVRVAFVGRDNALAGRGKSCVLVRKRG